MPTTPDRRDGRSAGSGDEYDTAEAAHRGVRDLNPLDPDPPDADPPDADPPDADPPDADLTDGDPLDRILLDLDPLDTVERDTGTRNRPATVAQPMRPTGEVRAIRAAAPDGTPVRRAIRSAVPGPVPPARDGKPPGRELATRATPSREVAPRDTRSRELVARDEPGRDLVARDRNGAGRDQGPVAHERGAVGRDQGGAAFAQEAAGRDQGRAAFEREAVGRDRDQVDRGPSGRVLTPRDRAAWDGDDLDPRAWETPTEAADTGPLTWDGESTGPIGRAAVPAGRTEPPLQRDGPGTADEDAENDRETVRLDARERPTVRVDAARVDAARVDAARSETVRIDRARRARNETARLPGPRRPADTRKRAPLVVAAGFATIWAALLSYLPVTAVIGLARTLEGAGGLGGALHAGLAGWLLGHGVPIGTSIGPLALAPLLLTLLVGWRLDRAALHVTRAIGARGSGSPRTALKVAGTIGVAYAILGGLAALLVDSRGTAVSTGHAALNFFVLGGLGSLIGSLRSTEGLVRLARRIPPVLRHGLRTGLVAAVLVVAAGAAFAGLSVAIGGGQAADMIAAYRTGTAGQAGITLVSLAYAANAAIWAAAYLLGPGFLLGTGSVVRLTEVTVGPLPTLPLVAGLPNGPVGATGAALLAVPVLIGMVAGWLLTRRLSRGRGHGAPNRPVRGGRSRPGEPPHHPARVPWSRLIGAALITGPVAGMVLGGLAWLSGGALGDGRLAQIGPGVWPVALVATAVLGVSTTIGAAAARSFRSGPPRP
ncbi:MAG: hypothetical protein QOE51_3175 [Actinoplanes sp.]|jgi:hypothetical protein|nr:hypothetical protein [Actinoplanes sp.]